MEIVCILLRIYMLVLLVTAVLSWFPAEPGGGVDQVSRTLRKVVDPVLEPLRRVIPPVGMFDLSFMVLFFAVVILQQVVCR